MGVKWNIKGRRNWRETNDKERDMYRTYKMWYDKQFEKLDKRGYKMYAEYYKTKGDFMKAYRDTKNQLKEEVRQGKRKGVGNVYQYMVRQQAYKYSEKQVLASIPYMLEHGIIEELPTTIKDKANFMIKYRQGELFDKDFNALVEARYKELKKISLAKHGNKYSFKEEVYDQITQEFYGGGS